MNSVRQTHRTGRLIPEVDADAQEVRWAGRLTAFATHTILSPRRRSDLTGLATIPRHHLKHIQGAGTDTLRASDAGVVDLDGVGHVPATYQSV